MSFRTTKGIGGHQRSRGATDEWLTPRDLITKLGEFDLDPCSPINRPWPTADRHFTIRDNGLAQKWDGRVWLNPPYGGQTGAWIQKLAHHGNGIALIFARTETAFFQNWVFGIAKAMLFIKGRVTFCGVDGKPGRYNGGAPSVLIAYGWNNRAVLRECGIPGAYAPLSENP